MATDRNAKFRKWEKAWERYQMKDYPQHERVLTHVIEDKARAHGDKIVFQFGDEHIISNALLNENVNKFAHGFQRIGVKKGEHVALMMPNTPEYIYTWFGLNKIGAVEVTINNFLRGDGLWYQIDQSDSVALLIDANFLQYIEPIADQLEKLRHIIVYRKTSDAPAAPRLPFEMSECSELYKNPGTAPKVDEPPSFKDVTTIIYTSGTTGRPKGVTMTHHYWYEVWLECAKYSRYVPDDVLYTGLPFFHSNAHGMTIGPTLLADAKAVIVERFSASRIWDDLRKYQCTEFNYIGGMLPIMLKQPERDDDADNPVRITVGAAAPKEIWEQFEKRFNLKIQEIYGLTECFACLANPYDEPRVGSCGKPITGWSVKIVDDNDNEVPPGTPGEFVARPERMWVGTPAYYKKPEATLEFFQNFWMHTGDLGKMDADGFFYFIDRKKQAIRRRGENISSYEVEKVITEHPAVLESAVVGVPSEVGEEEVKACIILNPGMSLTPEELMQWCEPRMAYFMIPRYVEFRDSFPKTGSERVEKYKLKQEGVTPKCWDREKAGYKLKR